MCDNMNSSQIWTLLQEQTREVVPVLLRADSRNGGISISNGRVNEGRKTLIRRENAQARLIFINKSKPFAQI